MDISLAGIPTPTADSRRISHNSMLPSVYDLTRAELTESCNAAGFPAFRVSQLWHWLYRQQAATWQEMHNLSPDFRVWLNKKYHLPAFAPPPNAATPHSATKLLIPLRNGDSVETVILPAGGRNHNPNRYTLCLSCQVGCRFNCAFCASGKAGFIRNLTTGEIISQLMTASATTGHPPSNIVFMGIGEPFDNYDNVLKAARIINDPDGLKIGARRITVSTCGIIPGIRRFAEEGRQFELSVSLHAPENSLRSRLMPANNKYPLPELMQACREYTAKTNRIITFEYTLIKDINDRPEHARTLVKLLRQLPCRVNLIPLSPVDEFDGHPSTSASDFEEALQQAHINVTLRNSQGTQLKAACGQLRFSKNDEQT